MLVHSHSNNLLAAAGVCVIRSAALLRKAKHDRRVKAKASSKKAIAIFACTLAWSYVDGYRTPRPSGFLRVDHPGGPASSFWYQLKANMRVDAIFCYLGVTPAVLARIVDAARPLDTVPSERGGRPRWLTLEDIVALGLRRLQVFSGQRGIVTDFGLTRSSGSYYLRYAEGLLHDTMPLIHEARMCFPSARIAKAAFDGVKRQFGDPPRGTLPRDEVIGYLIDGTFSPGRSCSNGERQRLFKGKKGIGYNHIIAFDYFGHIIDMSVAHPASVHDSKACKYMMQRFQDEAHNVARVSGLADSAFRAFCNNGSDGRIPMYRALISEYYGDVDRILAELFSAKMTTYRQADEWANGCDSAPCVPASCYT